MLPGELRESCAANCAGLRREAIGMRLADGRRMSAIRFVSFVALLATACSEHGGGGHDDAETPLACPDDSALGGALAFDGVEDYAKTAVDPRLGLTTFTIEAWVRRD